MEQTLNALSGLLLKALPTFFLLAVLHFYFKRMFFQPMDKVLRERDEAIQGLRQIAQEGLARTAQLTAEFEAGLSAARSDLYREQDDMRRKWAQERAALSQESRRRSQAVVKDAKLQLAGEVSEAKRILTAESDRLASEITESILHRRRH